MMRQEDIIQWAQERHIFDSATPDSQHGKTLEEVQELTDALADNNEAEIKDAIGDLVVTLILQAHMHGWSLDECVEAAYQEIKDRKGRMVDGVFVKEGGMNRDELLTKLAMELAEWPECVAVDGREWNVDGFAWQTCFGGRGPEVSIARVGLNEFEDIREHHWIQRRAELINKPSWDEAPKWAEYLSQDADGTRCWWEFEPERDAVEWFEPEYANGSILIVKSKGACPAGHDWRQTLERRPTESKEIGVIYAINTRTKEHIRVPHSTIIPPSSDHRLVHADADGWIPWEGGDCPLPKNRGFDAITRDGGVHEECNLWRWNHAGLSSDLIAYRPILDEPSEPEAENRTPESAAVATLERLGYRYCGGMEWKPPLGPSRSFETDGDYFVFGDAESVEWDGGGKRPPAGSICMLRNRSLDGASCPAYIEYMSEQSCVWSWRDDGLERTMHAHPSALEFRPIRSEECRAVEAMLEVVHGNGHLSETGARALYRAGYRKQEGDND